MRRALIDGHNAIQILHLHGEDHRDSRRQLLALARAAGNDPTVFFDARGAPPHLLDPAHEDGVRVVYCRDREADDGIHSAILDAVEPRNLIVVTNDRGLGSRARAQGAVCRSIEKYFERVLARRDAEPEDVKPTGRDGWRAEDFGLPDQIDLNRPPPDLR